MYTTSYLDMFNGISFGIRRDLQFWRPTEKDLCVFNFTAANSKHHAGIPEVRAATTNVRLTVRTTFKIKHHF